MKYDDKEKVEGLTFSATGLAYSYSQTGFPYAKEMWESMVEVLNPDLTRGLVDEPHPIAARSEIILNALKDTGITQMVEFASGWSTHGLHLCKNNPDFKYVEVLYKNAELGIDEAAEKRQVLAHLGEKIGGIPENYYTIGGDVLDEQVFEEAAALLDPSKKVAATNVGLMGYFDAEQKEKFATNIKNLLQEFGGKWITQDLVPREISSQLRETLNKQMGSFYPLESQEQIDDLLDKVGLKGNLLSDNTVKQKLSNANPHYMKNSERFCKYTTVDIDKEGDV